MTSPVPTALAFSRRALRVLIIVNYAYGAAILAILLASFTARTKMMAALGVGPAPDPTSMIGWMRLIMVVGIASVPLAHVILTRLLAIVDTVREGDPFIVVNGERLQTIAWSLLAMQALGLLVGFAAARIRSQGQRLDIDWGLSLTPWLAIILLFVLARVFEQGARMRADLEGTV